MATPTQGFALTVVLAFGLGVLLTLECVEADAQQRIHAARRAALDCHDQAVTAVRFTQPTTGAAL